MAYLLILPGIKTGLYQIIRSAMPIQAKELLRAVHLPKELFDLATASAALCRNVPLGENPPGYKGKYETISNQHSDREPDPNAARTNG